MAQQFDRFLVGRFGDGPGDQVPHAAAVVGGGDEIALHHGFGAFTEDLVVATDVFQSHGDGVDEGFGPSAGDGELGAAGDRGIAHPRGPGHLAGGVEHQHRPGLLAAGAGQRGEFDQVRFGRRAQQCARGGQGFVHQVGAGFARLGGGERAGGVFQWDAQTLAVRPAVQRDGQLLQRGAASLAGAESGAGPAGGSAGGLR